MGSIVGFEKRGNEELILPGLAAKADLAKLILREIKNIAKQEIYVAQTVQPSPTKEMVISNSNLSVVSSLDVGADSKNVFGNDDQIVELNVGGTVFATKRKNLNICTYLDLEKKMKLASGEYFIDRDPVLFRHILQYLRDSSQVPNGHRAFLNQIYQEANYFGIHPLISDLDALMKPTLF